MEIVNLLERFSGKSYADSRYKKSFRVIADHIRAATIMLGDGGEALKHRARLCLRRLIRRRRQHAKNWKSKKGPSIGKYPQPLYDPRNREITSRHIRNLMGRRYAEITGEIWKRKNSSATRWRTACANSRKIAKSGYISGNDAALLLRLMVFLLK